MPTPSVPPFSHGELRGDEDLRRSRTFEGRFGRMFRSLDPADFTPDPNAASASAVLTQTSSSSESGRDASQPAAPSAVQPKTSDAMLEELAKRMSAGPNALALVLNAPSHAAVQSSATQPTASTPPPATEIPAGYTYLGQFIGHDITFDPASSLQRDNDPQGLVDYRTPLFDLDSLYGRGPADQPYLYDADRVYMRLGEPIGLPGPMGELPTDYDLLRVIPDRSGDAALAIIGDPRNDENVILSQLHGIFLRFHNRVAMEMGVSKLSEVGRVQQYVRWHYQWIILYDFLPRIVNWQTYKDILPVKGNSNDLNVELDLAAFQKKGPQLRFYKVKNEAFIPVEFSVAAYRFGHSTVLPKYFLNGVKDPNNPQKPHPDVAGPFWIMPEFVNGKFNFANSLAGRRRFRRDWAIDWSLFFDLTDVDKNSFLHQPAKRINTKIVEPLENLPPEVPGPIRSLAARNLIRGFHMELPSGQAVANAMGYPPNDATLEKLKELDGFSVFADNAPLWYYILAEADGEGNGKLGPVGGRIVMETMIGLMMEDGHSVLRSAPGWKPYAPGKPDSIWKPASIPDSMKSGRFGMAELICLAQQWKKPQPQLQVTAEGAQA